VSQTYVASSVKDRELLRAHVEALFTLDAAGRMLRVNESGGGMAPRFFIGRTREGSDYWYRNDLAADTVRRLQAVCEKGTGRIRIDGSIDPAPFWAVLESSAPVRGTWSGPAFRFPDRLSDSPEAVRISRANVGFLRPNLGGWCEEVMLGRTVYAVVVDGQAVSVCASVRETDLAHEAGVETSEAFRGNGYAGQAVGAWAAAVRHQNRIPLYSTSWDNVASRAVARKLSLVQFASDLHIS